MHLLDHKMHLRAWSLRVGSLTGLGAPKIRRREFKFTTRVARSFCLPLLLGEVRFVVKKLARYEPNGVKQSLDPNLKLLKHSF